MYTLRMHAFCDPESSISIYTVDAISNYILVTTALINNV